MGGGPLTSVFESSHSGNEIRCWLVIVVVHSLFPFFSFCSFITPLAYSQAVSYRDFRRSKMTLTFQDLSFLSFLFYFSTLLQ